MICEWKHPDCAANRDGECGALIDCIFPNRKDCPFYKSRKQLRIEKAECRGRLNGLGIETEPKTE